MIIYHLNHDDVIKLKHFPRYWPFVRGIHRSRWIPPHKGQWRGALMFSLIYARINGWIDTGEAGDLRRHNTHYDVIVMPKHGLIHSRIYALVSLNELNIPRSFSSRFPKSRYAEPRVNKLVIFMISYNKVERADKNLNDCGNMRFNHSHATLNQS